MTDPERARDPLREHLVRARLAGWVATQPSDTLRKCARVVAGDPDATFGLPDWRDATFLDVVRAVREVVGGDPGGTDPDGDGYIDADRTMAAIELHRGRLAEVAAAGGCRVLVATGHPTGLLPHWAAVARALQATGSVLVSPLDDADLPAEGGRRRIIRYLDGVACLADGGALLHTHRSEPMEAILDAAGSSVELVLADHGWAGAAIARGIPTLSIADVNDPALPLAQVVGRTDAVLPIDDNLAPSTFVPVTERVLAWDYHRDDS